MQETEAKQKIYEILRGFDFDNQESILNWLIDKIVDENRGSRKVPRKAPPKKAAKKAARRR